MLTWTDPFPTVGAAVCSVFGLLMILRIAIGYVRYGTEDDSAEWGDE